MKPLSPRQRDMLREMLAGCCREAIAARCGIGVATVTYHQNELFKRLGVHSQAQLMARFMAPTDEARRMIDGH